MVVISRIVTWALTVKLVWVTRPGTHVLVEIISFPIIDSGSRCSISLKVGIVISPIIAIDWPSGDTEVIMALIRILLGPGCLLVWEVASCPVVLTRSMAV